MVVGFRKTDQRLSKSVSVQNGSVVASVQPFGRMFSTENRELIRNSLRPVFDRDRLSHASSKCTNRSQIYRLTSDLTGENSLREENHRRRGGIPHEDRDTELVVPSASPDTSDREMAV